jgi:hypothetical protein
MRKAKNSEWSKNEMTLIHAVSTCSPGGNLRSTKGEHCERRLRIPTTVQSIRLLLSFRTRPSFSTRWSWLAVAKELSLFSRECLSLALGPEEKAGSLRHGGQIQGSKRWSRVATVAKMAGWGENNRSAVFGRTIGRRADTLPLATHCLCLEAGGWLSDMATLPGGISVAVGRHIRYRGLAFSLCP